MVHEILRGHGPEGDLIEKWHLHWPGCFAVYILRITASELLLQSKKSAFGGTSPVLGQCRDEHIVSGQIRHYNHLNNCGDDQGERALGSDLERQKPPIWMSLMPRQSEGGKGCACGVCLQANRCGRAQGQAAVPTAAGAQPRSAYAPESYPPSSYAPQSQIASDDALSDQVGVVVVVVVCHACLVCIGPKGWKFPTTSTKQTRTV
eukprot:scaffold128706_cov16-Tisochrysis_lutea.AAC.1